ncbi:MAG: GatB/YqeY domain-containing protein [Bacteroidales bacterium]|jgi:uncharacterized protein YqeY|nr:GatB/YqeY domain-containing protein [Bacteroidales bacterium]
MTLQEQIKNDMITAMKSKNAEVVNLLRVVSGEFSRIGKELSDEQSLKVLHKMSKNAKELGNKNEVKILNEYLPEMFDYYQTKSLIVLMIENNDFSGMKDMGKVMGMVKNHEKSHCFDGKLTSNIVKEMLG